MPVVKKLVNLMNGTIDIESELGKGTSVTITIPHKIVTRDELVRYANNINIKNDKLIVDKRILLVEDNELNAEIALIILSDANFICEHVTNGEEAVKAIKEHPIGYYDIVLMDIQMPVMDGYQATHMIRSLDNDRSKIPIVAMTANALEEDKRAALASGMNGHIAKPIDISKLLYTLFDILV